MFFTKAAEIKQSTGKDPTPDQWKQIKKEAQLEYLIGEIESGEVIGGGLFGLIDPDRTWDKATKEERKTWVPDVDDKILQDKITVDMTVPEESVDKFKL